MNELNPYCESSQYSVHILIYPGYFLVAKEQNLGKYNSMINFRNPQTWWKSSRLTWSSSYKAANFQELTLPCRTYKSSSMHIDDIQHSHSPCNIFQWSTISRRKLMLQMVQVKMVKKPDVKYCHTIFTKIPLDFNWRVPWSAWVHLNTLAG